jgi:pimeloyl-ACP methyl ester carboxylesterase
MHARGAHGSQGRTSWSGRPELDDYTSYTAFFIHYMCYIQPISTFDPISTSETSSIAPPLDGLTRTPNDTFPIVILGGYSYGSMILRHLPPVPTILQPFTAPVAGSTADEILIRARKLADQSKLEWHNIARDEARAKRTSQAGHNSRPSMAMGGEETSPDKRRSSRDVRRSVEGGSRLDIRTRLRSLSHRRQENSNSLFPPETKSVTITMPEVRYLLISPLTSPISTLAAPALGHSFWGKSRDGCQDVIGKHPSLAVYGDQDIFTSAKRIRDWSAQLKSEHASRFSSVEVTGAGHFWVESNVEEKLRTALKDWESSIR